MTIATDLDCTINNLVEAVLQEYNILSGDNLTVDDITDYDVSKFIKPEYKNQLWWLWSDPIVWHYVEWYVKPIARLLEQGQDTVLFVTSTYPTHVGFKFKSLCDALVRCYDLDEQRVRDYVASHLVVTADKHIIHPDVMIDDCFDNLLLEHSDVDNIIIEQPWNKRLVEEYHATYPECKPIIICRDINTIPDIIEILRERRG